MNSIPFWEHWRDRGALPSLAHSPAQQSQYWRHMELTNGGLPLLKNRTTVLGSLCNPCPVTRTSLSIQSSDTQGSQCDTGWTPTHWISLKNTDWGPETVSLCSRVTNRPRPHPEEPARCSSKPTSAPYINGIPICKLVTGEEKWSSYSTIHFGILERRGRPWMGVWCSRRSKIPNWTAFNKLTADGAGMA